ncbi:hypothetical protein SSTU70S_03690 [Stutzerimonas stutzeri]
MNDTLTYARVFKAAGLTNLSDIQAVLDAVEAAIAQLAPQPEQSGMVEALRELLYARTDKSEALAIAALAAHRAGGGEHE